MRQDGLVAFVSNGLSAPKAIAPATAPGMVAASSAASPTSKVVQPPAPSVQPLAASNTSFQVAYSVKNLTGYVRTPYTNPPRLVDVRGQSAGSKMVCPYTQKPFIVPAEAVNVPAKSMMAARKSKPAPAAPSKAQAPIAPAKSLDEAPKLIATAPPAPQPKPQAAPATAPAPKTTSLPVAKTTPKTEPKKAPAPTVAANTAPTKPAADPTPKIEPKTEPAPAPQAAAPKLPFGAPIPGRPGFVNSPFAEKHQLVDVTGLSVGTEVKCPYTGKLFRVPPQAQAKR